MIVSAYVLVSLWVCVSVSCPPSTLPPTDVIAGLDDGLQMSSTLSTFAKSQMAADERESELKVTRRGLEERLSSVEAEKVWHVPFTLLLEFGRHTELVCVRIIGSHVGYLTLPCLAATQQYVHWVYVLWIL